MAGSDGFDDLVRGWEDVGDGIEAARRLFRELRPHPSRFIVADLWRAWEGQGFATSLMGSAEEDVALALHAQAYGLFSITRPPRGYLADALAAAESRWRPLTPPPLEWGPRAGLQDEVTAALDSSVLDVWQYTDADGTARVLIVGEGFPALRQRVVPNAFMNSLLVWADVNDFVNVGAISIGLGSLDRSGLREEFPVPLVGERNMSASEGKSGREALNVFLGETLRALSRGTGAVRMNEVERHRVEAFTGAVRRVAVRAERPVILAANRNEALVAALPQFRVGRAGGLTIELHGDLLRTDRYLHLKEVHSRATLEAVKEDLRVREAHNRMHAERMKLEGDQYKAAYDEDTRPGPDGQPIDRETRFARWSRTVTLDQRPDADTGMPITLAQPETVDSDDHHLFSMPSLAEFHGGLADKNLRAIRSLEATDARADAPLERLAISRFLDAAARDRKPDESESTRVAFSEWSNQIAPMLRYEWRRRLAVEGAGDATDIFGRQTFFHTRALRGPGEDVRLLMAPQVIVDRSRSAIVVDPSRPLLQVADATQFAQEVHSDGDGEAVWRRVAEWTSSEGKRTFADEFWNALREAPATVLRKAFATIWRDPAFDAASRRVEEELVEAQQHPAPIDDFWRGMAAFALAAPQTARHWLLQSEQHPGPHVVRARLLRFIVECHASLRDPVAAVRRAGEGAGKAARDAYDAARDADADYVDKWASALTEDNFVERVRALRDGLGRSDGGPVDTPPSYALVARRAVELAEIARRVERQAASLPELGGPRDWMLAQIGNALDELLLGDVVGGRRDEAEDLIAALCGSELRW